MITYRKAYGSHCARRQGQGFLMENRSWRQTRTELLGGLSVNPYGPQAKSQA
jgi:hypothetical protein